jgi:predicted O-linked N-acetylglucosamine transferase (SPINDLY family)
MSVGRNDPCPCGSGKKYKQCCGGGNPLQAALDPAAAALVQQALAHFQAGRLAQSEACCQQALQREPRQADAYHLLGLIAQQAGQGARAVELIGSAIRLAPSAFMHFNRGTALLSLRRLDDALSDFRRAVAIMPAMAQAHASLAQLYQHLGRQGEAVASCQQALRHQPDQLIAHLTLGRIYREQGKLAEAEAAFRQGLSHAPGTIELLAGLGLALHQQGRLDEAEASFRQLLALQADHFETLVNLITLLQQKNQLGDALEVCTQALQRLPAANHFQALQANLLMMLGRYPEAAEACQRALAADPGLHSIRITLGNVQFAMSQLDEAAASYRQVLAAQPGATIASSNLGNVLLAQGQPEAAITAFRAELARNPDYLAAWSNLLLAVLYVDSLSPAQIFAEQQRFAAHFEAPLKARWQAHDNVREPGKRLKVGYVSGDFCNHALAFFIEPILACHDKTKVEVFCYYNNVTYDAVTTSIQGLAEHWRHCAALSDDELAAQIRRDGIDILVDLSGHTALNRLLTFARKPAPVQVTWMGYPGSTGLTAMDYRLTDARLDPEGLTDPFHTETLCRLPASATFKAAAGMPAVNALPALNAGHVTLACLNNLAKISPTVIRLWARMLAALPGARLLLGNATQASVRERLLSQLTAAGADATRIEFVPKLSLHAYMRLHHRIDLALDSYPYGGGTTSSHALSMGVPVVTLAGATTASRQGAAILTAAGLPELIAENGDEYVSKAVQLASDLPRLEQLRQSLRGRTGAAAGVGAAELTRALEGAYAGMWGKWCEG